MARSRNIKPGFFTNEDLVELDFATRLLFAGLWTVADKAGRLQDRPKKIKIDVFPADNLDIDAMLSALHNGGFIVRYEVDGGKFIQITNWNKHQNPHHTEKNSVIPAQPNGDLTVKQPLRNVNARLHNGGNPADSLIPDSLIPDSGFTDTPPAAAAPSRSSCVSVRALVDLDVSQQVATDFLAIRKAKRAPLTQTALQGIQNQAEKAGITLENALRVCVERGWQSYKAEWDRDSGKKNSHDLSGKDWREGLNPDGSF